MTKISKSGQAEAIARLRVWLKPGATVHTILRHVSRSGMQRTISVRLFRKDGQVLDLDYNTSITLGMSLDRDRSGIKIGGCGMDMGFEIVYRLGRAVFPNGFKLAKGQYGRNGDKSGFDNDGGYAFKQVWL